MHDRRNFDDLVFPRIYAFAERAWIQPANRDFAGFRSRLSVFPRGLPRTSWNH
jgi:N-acetyl-beta-hexosaminidase